MAEEPLAPAVSTTSSPSALTRLGPALPVAVIAVAAAGVGFLAGGVALPPFVEQHGLALAIAVVGGVMAIGWVRRGVRRQLRASATAKVAEFGGGIYGSLAFATLLYLETMDLVGDVAAAGSPGAFLGRLDFGWLMAQMMESIGFVIQAAMWPWFWFSELGPATAGLVAGGVWALNGAASKLWERWRGPSPEPLAGVAGSEQNP